MPKTSRNGPRKKLTTRQQQILAAAISEPMIEDWFRVGCSTYAVKGLNIGRIYYRTAEPLIEAGYFSRRDQYDTSAGSYHTRAWVITDLGRAIVAALVPYPHGHSHRDVPVGAECQFDSGGGRTTPTPGE